MIKLTRPDGSTIWVFKAWIQCISAADEALNPNASTLVTMSGASIAVLEKPDVIVSRLEG